MVEVAVNWEDPSLKRWLNPMTRQSTKWGYRSAFKAYAYFTGMTASTLVDEALTDLKKDIVGLTDLRKAVEQYIQWLQ